MKVTGVVNTTVENTTMNELKQNGHLQQTVNERLLKQILLWYQMLEEKNKAGPQRV